MGGGERKAGPGAPPPLRPFGLVLHHDGRWSHEGAPLLNRKLRQLFDRSVRVAPEEGKFVVQVKHFRGQIEVEEAAFFVRDVDLELGQLRLSDGSVEVFDVASLVPSAFDRAWLCRVKRDLRPGGVLARFGQAAQAEVQAAVSIQGDRIVLRVAGHDRALPAAVSD